jgi:hypothetical protein
MFTQEVIEPDPESLLPAYGIPLDRTSSLVRAQKRNA